MDRVTLSCVELTFCKQDVWEAALGEHLEALGYNDHGYGAVALALSSSLGGEIVDVKLAANAMLSFEVEGVGRFDVHAEEQIIDWQWCVGWEGQRVSTCLAPLYLYQLRG